MSLLPPSWLRRAAILVSLGIAALGIWYFATGSTYVPRGVLRIGFEHVPPVQIRTDSGVTGLAVDIVNEAAKRAGLSMQWIETGTSSEEALRRGLVDLWPLMADLPDRRKHVHIMQPYLHTTHTLVLRAGSVTPDRTFSGRVALLKIPLHVRLAGDAFPKAQLVQFRDVKEILKDVCLGTSGAAFLEDRGALTALRDGRMSAAPSRCALSPFLD
jgi:two-component system, cell cycle sensor histidine kinase and response regulator CckA